MQNHIDVRSFKGHAIEAHAIDAHTSDPHSVDNIAIDNLRRKSDMSLTLKDTSKTVNCKGRYCTVGSVSRWKC
jgi:hypothetical protein